MEIYPAIDILDGKVVRLRQGRYEDVTVYNDDPADQAKWWADAGATIIHVVDLDGAAAGEPQNLDAVERIVGAVKIPVQLGGGLRQPADIERAFEIGVARAVLGTTLVTAPERVAEAIRERPGRIVAAIDARDGKVRVEGWREGTEHEVVDLLADLELLGVSYLLYTDIGVDGMLTGVNARAYEELVRITGMKVIASGGVSTLEDVRELRDIVGLEGVIVGRALYEGTVDLAEAIAVARGA